MSADVSNEWMQNVKPEWNEIVTSPLAEKLSLIEFDVEKIFPFNDELSQGVDVNGFNTSFLIQPDVFIRVRPGKQAVVKKKLAEAQIAFTEVNESCIAVANGTKLENIVDINREAVIQDFNSQRVGELLLLTDLPKSAKVWDCCAASGGKSIMTYDLLPNIQLTVSDVRQSIIQNLHNRFKEAGIKGPQSFVADLTNPKSLQSSLKNSTFDLIICDAPCSGSGTWSRTPEQLLFFKEEEIIRYSNLQKSIATNAILYLKKGGYFLYITCSVFKKENEVVVEFIQRQSNLQLIKVELLRGFAIKADSMFAALFVANK
ncbi:MAG: Fmu (Sun) domain protein [Segetibacter sp.]|nr:Fmu (Sun) domain protein [Segetibacter sp.]